MKTKIIIHRFILYGFLGTLMIAFYQCSKVGNPVQMSKIPEVVTASVIPIDTTRVLGGGLITNQGASVVTSWGLCWSTNGSPDLSDDHSTDSLYQGSLLKVIRGLRPGTTYYVRAYAINSEGTGYRQQEMFSTSAVLPGQPCPGMPTITDLKDGKVYPTVQIGEQCWLQKNLNYDRPATFSWCYNNDPECCEALGRIYQYQEKNICPIGFHIPSKDEWSELINFLGGPDVAGEKMKSVSGWYFGGNGSNSSGFLALPGGGQIYGEGDFSRIGTSSLFWSATLENTLGAYVQMLEYSSNTAVIDGLPLSFGCYIRCIQNSYTSYPTR